VKISFSAPVARGTEKREGAAPKARRRFFGGARKIAAKFQRLLGRSRKSRVGEAAGRRNCPEAVPEEQCGRKGKMYRASSFGRG